MRQVGLVQADRMYAAKRQIVESLGFGIVQVRDSQVPALLSMLMFC